MSGARILVIDDEAQLRRSMRLILSGHDYDVVLASTGEAGLDELGRRRPDLVLLDLMLPDIDGLEVCRRIRERSRTAIVVLSARGEEETKVAAFDAGADDYVTKPFGAQELLARVRVALRHTTGLASETYSAAGLVVDIFRRVVTLNAQPVSLTPREYDVLKFFVTHADRVLTHTMILKEVWGGEYANETQYLRNVVLALRRKLKQDPSHPALLLTEPGIGYRLQSEPT